MVSTACQLLCSTKLFSSYSLKTNGDHRSRTLAFLPLRPVRAASVAAKQGQLSAVVPDAKLGSIADPKGSDKSNKNGENSGKNSTSVAGSSGVRFSFLNIFSAWNVWLTTAAVLASATIYRRMRRVEAILEKTEETTEIAKRVIDKAAEEAREIQTEVMNRNDEDEGTITGVAFNLGRIAEMVEKNTHKAQEALRKVQNLEMEVEELLEAKMEEGCNLEEDNHKHN